MRTISGIRRNVKNHGRCSIFVDGDFFAACPIDVALALGLKKGIELTVDLERRLRSEDRRMVLRQKSYRFATYKPRTESQVRQHLEKLEATPEEIDSVIAWLAEFRVVDDREYVRRFVDASKERKPLSPAAARRTLLQRGIERSIVDEGLEGAFTEDQTVELAVRVAEKKRRMLKPGTEKEQEDRIVRFLQYRGYSWPVIRAVIERLFTIVLLITALTISVDVQAQNILSCQRWRLSRTVNDYQPATLPLQAPDGSLFFDRKLHPLNADGSKDPDDVWISRRRGGMDWTEPVRESFTSVRRPDVVFNFTFDGLSALVVGRYLVKNYDTIACFALLHRQSSNTKFDRVEPIDLPSVPGLGKNFFAHISNDRNTIIVAMDGLSTVGDMDLYVSRRCASGWSELRSLGLQINTKGLDAAPWLASDGTTLYFTSNGRDDRKGKVDLYVTRRLDDTWTLWSAPRNLGSCINTVEDESSLSLIGRGDSALITSWDAETGRPGMYLAVLDPDVRPEPVTEFQLEVRDALTNEPVPNVEVIIVDSLKPNACTGRFRLDTSNNTALIALPQRGRYVITTTAPGYVPHRQVIGVHQLDTTAPLRITTQLFSGQRPLASVYFDRGASAITEEQMQRLRSTIAKYDLRQIRFEVMGYTDQLGTLPKNKTLSQQRADAVRAALLSIGIRDARIVASGKGIEKLAVSSVSDDEGRPESRRVDIYPAP